MPTQPEPLKHNDVEKKEDAVLVQEAQAYLAKSAPLQIVAELLTELRGKSLSWWTPDGLRTRYSAADRMKWLSSRADLRQQITTSLTGLVPKAARKKDPEFQAGLLDAAVDDGDVTAKAFEDAFEPKDLAVYGPAGDYWRQFRMRMPWTQDTPVHQELIAFLLKELLTDKGPLGLSRKPILTPWELRTNIAGKTWHTKMPVEVRVAIDEARFEREKAKPKEAFHAKDDLAIALPEIIASNIPLKELIKVFDAAERAMGFELIEAVTSASMRPEAPVRDLSDAPTATSLPPGSIPPPPNVPSIPAPPNPSATTSVAPVRGSKGPPPLRGMGSTSGSQFPPPVPPSADSSSELAVTKSDVGGSIMPGSTTPSVGPAPEVLIHDDAEMLFEVDIGSSEDMALAGLEHRGEERPTKA